MTIKDRSQWTSVDLNELADAVITLVASGGGGGSPPDNATLDLNGSSQLEIKSGGVGSTQLAAGSVTEAKLSTSDLTTADVTTAKHGFAPKAPNDATKYLDGTGTYSVPAGSAPSSVTKAIAQTAHGFSVGNLVRYNGTSWVTSKADAAANADVDGIVSAVADANNFTVALPGSYVTGLSGLTAGNDYFLDPTTAGAATATEPTTAGQVSAPVYKALTTTTVLFAPGRGLVIPAAATVTKEFVLIADAIALATGEDFASYVYEIGADLNGWSLTGAVWTVKTVSSSGVPSLGLRKNSTEMLSTNITIDASETSSRTAATPAVIKSDGSQTVASGDLLHFDCDAAGTGTKGSEVRTTWTSP